MAKKKKQVVKSKTASKFTTKTITKQEHRYIKLLLITSILAIIVSAYLTYLHYEPLSSSFCDISEGVSCDIVNKSIYSEFQGIPVAILGGVIFILLLFLSYSLLNAKGKTRNKIKIALLVLIFASLAFAFYLVYVELYLLYSLCLFCVTLDTLILAFMYCTLKLNENVINKNLIKFLKLIFFVALLVVGYLAIKILIELVKVVL